MISTITFYIHVLCSSWTPSVYTASPTLFEYIFPLYSILTFLSYFKKWNSLHSLSVPFFLMGLVSPPIRISHRAMLHWQKNELSTSARTSCQTHLNREALGILLTASQGPTLRPPSRRRIGRGRTSNGEARPPRHPRLLLQDKPAAAISLRSTSAHPL